MNQLEQQQARARERRKAKPDSLTVITLRITAAEHDRFLRAATLADMSLNQFVREACEANAEYWECETGAGKP